MADGHWYLKIISALVDKTSSYLAVAAKSNGLWIKINGAAEKRLATTDDTTTAENNAKAYADTLVVGLWDDRGNFDASGNAFPSSGGSGSAGAILKGDIWTVSVAGTLGGVAVAAGDTVRALVDTPGQTASNWSMAENNFGFTPENVVNKDTDGTLAANSDTKYASQKATKTYADTKTAKSANLSDLNNKETSLINLNIARHTFRKTGTGTYERWYSSEAASFLPTTAGFAKDILISIPFIVAKQMTIDRIGVEITGAGSAGSVVRLGIYDDNNVIPNNLVLDAGTIAGDSATVQSITINQTLNPGLYWLTLIHNSTSSITFRAIPADALPNVLGFASTIGTTNSGTGVNATFTYAALPNPHTTPTSVAVGARPIIAARLSA